MSRIFISYSHSHKAFTEKLADYLRRAHEENSVWFDSLLYGGEDWWRQILEQIADCDKLLFLISPESLSSESCRKELAEAIRLRKHIIPIAITPIDFESDDLPAFIKSLQIVDMSSGITPEGLSELEAALSQRIRKSSSKKVRLVASAASTLILAIAAILVWTQINKPDVKVAYEFLVDTSENMLEPLNNVPRYAIVNQAIQQIVSVPGLGASQIWRGVRLAGGNCNQTSLPVSGTNLTTDEFMNPLHQLSPNGTNAYRAGIEATFEDLNIPEVRESDAKIVFIMLGSLDTTPCPDFYLPGALAAYKQLGVSTTFCTFALTDDLLSFENFSEAMRENGFECVHNVETPQEINRIAINIIQQEIRKKIGEEELLPPALSHTPAIALRPSDTPILITLEGMATASSTDIPSRTATPIGTYEQDATGTEVPQPSGTVRIVSSEDINLRSGPGTNYSKVGTASPDETFSVIAQSNNEGITWYLIRVNREFVWISSEVAFYKGDSSQVNVAATIPASPIPSCERGSSSATRDIVGLSIVGDKDAHLTVTGNASSDWSYEIQVAGGDRLDTISSTSTAGVATVNLLLPYTGGYRIRLFVFQKGNGSIELNWNCN
jgi:hypothetical protein